MQIQVVDQKGKTVEPIKVDKNVFGAELNIGLIHEVAIAQSNNQRQGTKCTQTRSEVRGHAAKPYRQKGTGRARQGSTKGPHQIGGGVAFAPKPRDFRTKINKQKKAAAFISAISGKLTDKELVVLNNTQLKEIKTKSVVSIIEALKMEGKTMIFVTAGLDKEFVRAAANIQKVNVITAQQLSVLDIVNHKYVVASVDAVRAIESGYGEGA